MRGARAAACAGAALLVGGCKDDDTSAPPVHVQVVASVEQLDGVLAERRGHPLLVNFWATWCSPCVAELPTLVAIRAEMQQRGGEIIGVAMELDDPRQTEAKALTVLPKFLAAKAVDYPQLLWTGPDNDPLLDRFDLPGPIPVTLAIAADGQVVGLHEGQAEIEDLRRLVRLACRE